MRLQNIVEVSAAVAKARGRLEKTAALANLFRQLAPDAVPIAVGFLTGMLQQGRVGLGWSALAKARDLPAAEEASLELQEVDRRFDAIARVSGAGASQERSRLLTDLFTRATLAEQAFLVRLISGELRQGAVEGILTDAIAKAADVPSEAVRHAAMMCGNLGEAAQAALSGGEAALARYAIELFRPVEPMLASPAENIAEALEWLGEAAFELKLDGARIQVHKSGGRVVVFSRGLRDVTAAVPEVVELVGSLEPRELILDGEVIALHTNGRPRPFQETMKRFGRRQDVQELRKELPLTPVFFDCLYVDGRPLTGEPQRVRFTALMASAPALAVQHRTSSDRQEAETFLAESLAAGHEGLMAKAPEAPYAAGSRGRSWLKIKQAHTLDLVVLAAEWGSGRRQGWLSNLHLGARDPRTGGFVMLGKTFKGLTDEILKWQTAAFLERETGRERQIVFVRPELVVEIAFNDVQESPQYPGGLALRFARVKGYRPDKTAETADTIDAVRDLYRAATGRAD